MPKHYAVCLALVSSLLAPLLQGAAPPKLLGEIVGDDVYVNCEYRVAAQFPGEPKFKDITYRDGARTAPARQFYVERGTLPLSVTVVYFADGPEPWPIIASTSPRRSRRRTIFRRCCSRSRFRSSTRTVPISTPIR